MVPIDDVGLRHEIILAPGLPYAEKGSIFWEILGMPRRCTEHLKRVRRRSRIMLKRTLLTTRTQAHMCV